MRLPSAKREIMLSTTANISYVCVHKHSFLLHSICVDSKTHTTLHIRRHSHVARRDGPSRLDASHEYIQRGPNTYRSRNTTADGQMDGCNVRYHFIEKLNYSPQRNEFVCLIIIIMMRRCDSINKCTAFTYCFLLGSWSFDKCRLWSRTFFSIYPFSIRSFHSSETNRISCTAHSLSLFLSFLFTNIRNAYENWINAKCHTHSRGTAPSDASRIFGQRTFGVLRWRHHRQQIHRINIHYECECIYYLYTYNISIISLGGHKNKGDRRKARETFSLLFSFFLFLFHKLNILRAMTSPSSRF